MVQFHGEPYAPYGQFEPAGKCNAVRFQRLRGAQLTRRVEELVFLHPLVAFGCDPGRALRSLSSRRFAPACLKRA